MYNYHYNTKLQKIIGFIRDKDYREDTIEEYWNWKAKLALLCATIVAIMIGMVVWRAQPLWKCIGEEWDMGRDTKYGFVFNTCVIDSGRLDKDGNIIWTKVNLDAAPGDMAVSVSQ